jgi:hypothetical protein
MLFAILGAGALAAGAREMAILPGRYPNREGGQARYAIKGRLVCQNSEVASMPPVKAESGRVNIWLGSMNCELQIFWACAPWLTQAPLLGRALCRLSNVDGASSTKLLLTQMVMSSPFLRRITEWGYTGETWSDLELCDRRRGLTLVGIGTVPGSKLQIPGAEERLALESDDLEEVPLVVLEFTFGNSRSGQRRRRGGEKGKGDSGQMHVDEKRKL